MTDEELQATNYQAPITGHNLTPVKTVKPGPWWLLLIILIGAAAVRCWRLGNLPPAMFRDEAEKALNGWFLLNHGVDAAGRPWPVFVEVFDVTTSAIYQYATIPFLAVGGLNEWTARLPAALAGVTTVLFTWLLCKRVWGWQTAAWAAGMLAISPWHVPLSRWAQQGAFLPLLFVMAAWGVAGFLKSQPENREQQFDNNPQVGPAVAKWGRTFGLLFAAACVAIGMYAYDPARLFAPLLGLAAFAIWWRVWVRRWPAVCAAMLVFLLFASPVIWLFATEREAAQARFNHLSVFQPGSSMGQAALAVFQNYISHFTPMFLLLRGDQELRHSSGVGMLNMAELLFAAIGAIITLRHKSRWGMFILLWMLLAPVAASLTRIGVPHALRSQMALPAWQILAAVGITGVATHFPPIKQKAFHQVIALVVLLGALPFFISYFGSYSRQSAINWQYGVKQSLQFLNDPPTENSEVFFHNITGAEYLAPFYLKMDRPSYQHTLRGLSRYHFMPFQFPDRAPLSDVSRPAAWITPPGYTWPSTLFPVPITAPASEQMAPVMLIYLNSQLLEQIKEQAGK